MRMRPTFARPALLLVLGATLCPFAGCGRGQETTARSRCGEESCQPAQTPVSTGGAQDLYEAKRYAQAKSRALDAAQQQTGAEREVSLLTAGLAAHALQQYDDAATILTPLTRSEDSRIAGRAKTALDYIGIERGRTSVIGTPMRPSASGAGPARASVPPAAAILAHGYTLQAGVFTSPSNAGKRAAQMRPQAIHAGLGEPRIVPDVVNGKPAYAVQVGAFPTKQAANSARTRLSGQVVVTAVP